VAIVETDELANYKKLSLENKILVLAQAEALVFAEKTIEKRLAAENVAKNSKKHTD
jgi:hypothetical protein